MKKTIWLPWALMSIVLATTLAVGIVDADDPPTPAERATALARTIRCPQCQGETVAESNVAIAAAMRADIRDRVSQGQSDSEIRQGYANQYGDSVLLTPPGEGFGSVLWVVPIVAVIVAAAVLGVAWRQRVLGQRLLGQGVPAQGLLAQGVSEQGLSKPGVPEQKASRLSDEDKAGAKSEPPFAKRRKRRRSVVVVVALALVVAVLAGVLLARTVGFRSSSDEATGDIRQTTRGLIVRAGELTGQGDLEAAIATYDEVLSSEPSNVVALTYKGWLTWITKDRDTVTEQTSADASASGSAGDSSSGEAEAGLGEESRAITLESERLLTEAIAVDSAYPDARVFRTIIFANTNRWLMAQEELAVFDSLNPAADLRSLVDNSNIRSNIATGLAAVVTSALALPSEGAEPLTAEEVSAALSEFTEAQLNRAGVTLVAQEQIQPAAIVFSYLLQINPDNLIALSGRGYLFTLPDFVESDEVFNRGIADLDRAVLIAPDNLGVRLLRAQAFIVSDQRLDEARADLDFIDANNPSEEMQPRAQLLRERLDA